MARAIWTHRYVSVRFARPIGVIRKLKLLCLSLLVPDSDCMSSNGRKSALRHVTRELWRTRHLVRRRSAAAKLGWIIVGRRVVVVAPQTTRNGVVAIDPQTPGVA
jgi:hypothetical protein